MASRKGNLAAKSRTPASNRSRKTDRLSDPPERGHRVGAKKSDRRWQDEHGEIWASRFECKVYESARAAAKTVRRCDKGGSDTVSYTSPVRNGVCTSCEGVNVVQQRTYSPDLCVLQSADGEEDSALSRAHKYYVEAKGYLRASERTLLRSLFASNAIPDLRIILQADYRIGKHTIGWWIDRYLKCKWAVFDGSWPTEWKQVEHKLPKRAKRNHKKDS